MRAQYPTQKQLQIQVMQQIKEHEISEQFDRRMAGELPRIDIEGTSFTIDLRVPELRESAAPFNRIGIKEM
jgi:hypothetical protein